MARRHNYVKRLPTVRQSAKPLVQLEVENKAKFGLLLDDALDYEVAASRFDLEGDAWVLPGEALKRIAEQVRQKAVTARNSNVPSSKTGDFVEFGE